MLFQWFHVNKNLEYISNNKNANELAKHLQNHECIDKVFYPGLENSIYHNLAKNQMKD